MPSGSLGVVGVGELAGQTQWRAADLVPADERLLLGQLRAVPELDEHPDDAHGLVRPADRPLRLAVVGAHPDVSVHQRAVIHVQVGRSVLEPQQVSRRHGLRRLARPDAPGVAVDHPLEHQFASGATHQLPQRELHRVVVSGLEDDRDVAVRQLGIEPVVGQERHRDQVLRLALGQAEPVVEQRGPDSDHDRRGCPRVASRRGCRSRRAERPGRGSSGGLPAISPRISSVMSCSVALRLARSLVCRLNEATNPCSGMGSAVMPAWCRPSNGTKADGGRPWRGSSWRCLRQRHRGADTDADADCGPGARAQGTRDEASS